MVIVALVVAANVVRSNSTVRGLQVEVDYRGCDTLVTGGALERRLLADMPTIASLQVKAVDTKAIREQVETSPYVESCQSYVSILGTVVVRARQRQPLMHVYYGGRQFYVDRHGQCLPLSSEGMAHVLVVSGHFRQPDSVANPLSDLAAWESDTLRSDYDLTRMWRVVRFMHQEEYLPLFDQFYLDREGDLLLTPKAGTHVVNLGDEEELAIKFRHLMALYKQALPRVGWDRYSVVNLKFKDQVVCRKKGK